jgi:hypothetical protein
VAAVFLLIAACSIEAQEPNDMDHPFLIVRSQEYAELRARAENSPWKEMKAEAVRLGRSLEYDADKKDYRAKCLRLRDIVSTAALASILDPEQRPLYADNIEQALRVGLADLEQTRPGSWLGNTPLGCALFNAILALDIVHDAMAPPQREAVEEQIGRLANSIEGWQPSPQAVKGLWALYSGDAAEFRRQSDAYREHLMKFFTEDGVFMAGVGYAAARMSYHDREQKSLFLDVLEYHGEGNYYDDPRLVAFYEWLYGYAATPFGKIHTFGDSSPSDTVLGHSVFPQDSSTQLYRAGRFSQQAARYAAWRNEGRAPNPRLLTYVLMEKPLPEPDIPPSRIFSEGGAFLQEDRESPLALAGALWNAPDGGFHSHKDVNALCLAAYGEFILRNSGYVGAGLGAAGADWEYINNTARANNVVLINGVDHERKHGGGIDEGITLPGILDYACGDSGEALPNGRHWRSLLFVHPRQEAPGYFVVLDEVHVSATSDERPEVQLLLHPQSDDCSVVKDDVEYRWDVGPVLYSGRQVGVNAFLGAEPARVRILDGALASFDRGSFVGKYLEAAYPADDSGQAAFITALFPHDAEHAKAPMARLKGEGFKGMRVAPTEGVVDVFLQAGDKMDARRCESMTFQAKAVGWRERGDKLEWVFARQGTLLQWNGERPWTIEADKPFSMIFSPKSGKVLVHEETRAIVSCTAASSIRLGDQKAKAGDAVTLPKGEHPFEIQFRDDPLMEQ